MSRPFLRDGLWLQVSGVKPDTAVAAALGKGGGVTTGLKGWRLLGVSTQAAADLATAAGLHAAAALPAVRARAEVLSELKAYPHKQSAVACT